MIHSGPASSLAETRIARSATCSRSESNNKPGPPTPSSSVSSRSTATRMRATMARASTAWRIACQSSSLTATTGGVVAVSEPSGETATEPSAMCEAWDTNSAPPRGEWQLEHAFFLTSDGDHVTLLQSTWPRQGPTIDQGIVDATRDRRNGPLPPGAAIEHALTVVPKLAVRPELPHDRLAQFGAHAN